MTAQCDVYSVYSANYTVYSSMYARLACSAFSPLPCLASETFGFLLFWEENRQNQLHYLLLVRVAHGALLLVLRDLEVYILAMYYETGTSR